MADVEDARGLLVMAVQDLADGEAAMVERLPRVRGHARDPELQRILAEDAARSAVQGETLAKIAGGLGVEPRDAPNIWLRAILDDADDDAETIAAGPLRDIALTGAIRKGKQSERVSYETAIALAERLQMDEAAAALGTIRDEEAAADAALAEALRRLCGKA